MNDYDIALKSLLRRTGGTVLWELTGLVVERWHNVELPGVRQRNVDLLGETADGRMVHSELRSSNDSLMAIRMAEYALVIRREYGRFPEQVVLYVGPAPLGMETRVTGPHLSFECRFADIRDFVGDRLMESASLEDNIIGVLAGLRDERAAVRRVLTRIARSAEKERAIALAELMILAGLRKISAIIEQEAKQMPILDDILDHEVLGREFKRGLVEGQELGLEKGREEGREEGQRKLLLGLMQKRFGKLPRWAKLKLNALNASAIDEVGMKLLDAATLEDLLR